MIGKIVSHYHILEKLGEGGMGVVYKAEDLKLKRTVALKFLPPELTRDPEAKERFIQEAQAASALDHPNICTIHEIDQTEDGQMFIVMACYEGETLKKKVASGQLSVDSVIDIAIQIAQGLAKAHEHGIIHRDIKPANVMITNDGVAKILDFGLAKLAGQVGITKTGITMGTIAYMSPEQARGEEVDNRTDIWSLGVVLYEMLTGQLPFKGEYEAAMMYSIVNEAPEPVTKLRSDAPVELERIVNKALAKTREARYDSATELIDQLHQAKEMVAPSGAAMPAFQQLRRLIIKPRIAVPVVLLVMAAAIAIASALIHSAKVQWAREEALPEILQLTKKEQYTQAFRLAQWAEQYIPNNPQLVEVFSQISRRLWIETTPPGAEVLMRDYKDTTAEWEYLGTTPIDSLRISRSFKRWKISRNGYAAIERTENLQEMKGLQGSDLRLTFTLDTISVVPTGMVHIPSGNTPVGTLGDFFLDRFEVTNREYKAFVDSGGYRNPTYWKYPFVSEGQTLSWPEAMKRFVDATGRPGPSTWELGDYPKGQADYPVTGISWYEAAAYAEFVGKTLPTVHHWDRAAVTWNSGFIVPFSNFRMAGAARVGHYQGVSPFGTYDMAGNAKEWCWNEVGRFRAMCGGGWNDPEYMFAAVDGRPAFMRDRTFGFRCAKYLEEGAIYPTAFGSVSEVSEWDFRKQAQPCTDEVFKIYQRLFSYSKDELHAQVERRDDSVEDYVMEKVSFDAAYGKERVIAYLFLPRRGTPPFQTIIDFPGGTASYFDSIKEYPIRRVATIHTKSRRAFVMPVYNGTFERRYPPTQQWTPEFKRDLIYLQSKDLGRTIDYLETRSDFDTKKIAFTGWSWGGWIGVILCAVEPRFKAVVLIGGGLEGGLLPEVNPVNFAPRITIPVVLINGKYDHAFPLESNQKILYKLLGTRPEDKRHAVFETGHDVWSETGCIKEMLDFLDKYLGLPK